MELIDRYVAEVGRHLPEKSRPDIEKELHSILEDMLEDRAQAAGKPADEEMAAAMLKEYGEPSKIAATYHPPQSLIGPALYPTYLVVIKIVFTVITVLAVIGFGFAATRGTTGAEIGKSFLETMSSLFNGVITSLGIVTLIFAIIERVNPNLKIDEKKEWNPRDLQPVEKMDGRVKTGELVASIVFNLVAIILFNLYFDKIGIYVNTNGVWSFIPIFSEALRSYVPFFTILWGLEIALHTFVLQAGRWSTVTRWLTIAHSAASIVLLFVILTGPSILASTGELAAAWQQAGFGGNITGDLRQAMELGVRSVIGIILIVEIIEMGKQGWSLLRGRVESL